jgi:hypothetical protein
LTRNTKRFLEDGTLITVLAALLWFFTKGWIENVQALQKNQGSQIGELQVKTGKLETATDNLKEDMKDRFDTVDKKLDDLLRTIVLKIKK